VPVPDLDSWVGDRDPASQLAFYAGFRTLPPKAESVMTAFVTIKKLSP